MIHRTELLWVLIALSLGFVWWKYGNLTRLNRDIVKGQMSLDNPQYG